MQSVVVNFSIVRSNRNLGCSSAYGRLNWMTWPMRLSAEQRHRPRRNLHGHYKGRARSRQSAIKMGADFYRGKLPLAVGAHGEVSLDSENELAITHTAHSTHP